ncbi:MAG: GNAT family N-acetyltransferase [Planctomycetota bacterium]
MELSTLTSPQQEMQYRELARHAFNFPDDVWPQIVDWIERQNLRVLVDGETVLGGLAVYDMGQWFGGRRLPMAGYALVATDATRRGQGVAATMMGKSLCELATRFPIAALYASTQVLYRKVGFEQAGSANRYAAPLPSIGPMRQGPMRQGELARVDPDDHELFRGLHQQFAVNNNGCLDRTAGMWARLTRGLPHPCQAYLHRDNGVSTGYLLFDERPTQSPAWPRHSKQSELYVRDLVALTPSAYTSLLGLLAGHRSLTDVFSWGGPQADPWLLRCAENQALVVKQERWMLRILDVGEALRMRGYASGDGELHLRITDELIERNNAAYVLSVEDGVGVVRAGGQETVQLDIGALASLFSGYASAETLASLGRCRGDAAAIATASRLFRGDEPWMIDHF